MSSSTAVQSFIRTGEYGGNGGNPFPMALVREIGMHAGGFVDQIQINGRSYGLGGGANLGSITLDDDEYISSFTIRSGEFVDSFVITTNKGRTFGGGGSGGNAVTLGNLRVIGIGGSAGEFVDRLSIKFVEEYAPSVIEERNAGFIVAYSAPFQVFEEYNDSFYQTVDSYEKVTEYVMSQQYSASVEAEYYVKVAASTEIAITETSLETVKRELEQKLASGSRRTQTIPGGQVGVKLVHGMVMRGADGTAWMYPTTEPSYSVIPTTDVGNLLGHYDLTGELYTQMPGLRDHRTEKNGFVYYA